jgi:hypothetical protein
MKRINYILSLTFLLWCCNSEDAGDCFQTAGSLVQETVETPGFERILVNRDVELIVKSGSEHRVTIETGKNLLNDVEARVEGDQLILFDHNTCNFVRGYGVTRILVTAPNIREIRSSTQLPVSSDGVLNYNNLNLISEDFNAPGSFTVGDFYLNVNTGDLRIVSNLVSSFYISGQTENLDVGFFAGSGRFEGRDLIANNVAVFHRGSNDMIVNPQGSLTGALYSTGNLIALNRPDILEIEAFYTGRLIFED